MANVASAAESRSQRNKRMVSEMSNARTLLWVGVALLLHATVILGTSYSYIHEHWFGAKPAEAKAVDEAPAAAPASGTTSAAATKPPAAAPAAAAPAALPAGLSDDDKKLAERKNSPEVKSVTDSAKPGDIPKTPQHNAFDIDDTPK